jgi:hypothetical protein
MLKIIAITLLSFNVCAGKAEVEEAATDWAIKNTAPPLLHAACDEPVLGTSTCTFYYQNWAAKSAECNTGGCYNLRIGPEIDP